MVGVVGFEPTVSGTRNRRIPKLSHTPMFECRCCCAHSKSKSTRRELNPHFRRGMATGCRYITGAQNRRTELSKIVEPRTSNQIRAPGGTRTHVAALRVRSRAAGPPVRATFIYVDFVSWRSSPRYRDIRPNSASCNLRLLRSALGPEGFEPSPTRVRAGHAAANTSIPN